MLQRGWWWWRGVTTELTHAPPSPPSGGKVAVLSTSGEDGRVVLWELAKLLSRPHLRECGLE